MMTRKNFPRLNLISYPTPFHELANLRRYLGSRQRDLLDDDRDIVFVHTGGFPAVFHREGQKWGFDS